MTADHDRLDEAIDLVARRLTRVEDDELLAARIVAALPERRLVALDRMDAEARCARDRARSERARSFYKGPTGVLRRFYVRGSKC